MIKYPTSLFIALSLALFSLVTFAALPALFAQADSSGQPIDIWWPTDGAQISGVQPFKALLEGQDISTYDMYWQVDGGDLVLMSNNTTNSSHKEASVDLTNWNWHGAGPYNINFVAKQNGVIVGQHSVNIYLTNVSAAASTASTSTTTTTTAIATITATTTQIAPATTEIAASSLTTTAVSPTSTTSAAATAYATPTTSPAPTISATAGSISMWWPTPGSTLTGVQPFKALVNGQDVSTYNMYWQVDGGQYNLMQNNYTNYPHKEASVDVSGWNWESTGSYKISFIAENLTGQIIATYSEMVTVNASSGTQTASVTTSSASGTTSATNSTMPPSNSASNSSTAVLGMNLYVNPNSSAAAQANIWRTSNPTYAGYMNTLAAQPTAVWFGDWNSNIYNDVHAVVSAATSVGQAPVLVAYDIPQRDCGGYSSGGASPSAYTSWIQSFASAIGKSSAIVILEPDALAGISCLSSADQQTRLSLLSQAIKTLKTNSNTHVYIDAGHSGWVDAGTMAGELKQAGIGKADGFSLNVSNFNLTADETNYGAQISQQLGGKHFVMDTSRNGLGSNGQWCNPPGRAIGSKPTGNTGNALVDAYLWIKVPGESDGTCNGGPAAGAWWPDYAASLVQNAQ